MNILKAEGEMVANIATTAHTPVVKNLLIKDASGNTQVISVVEIAPGKFVTAPTATNSLTGVTGVKTIIRTTAPQNTGFTQSFISPQYVTTTSTPVTTGVKTTIIRTTPQIANTGLTQSYISSPLIDHTGKMITAATTSMMTPGVKTIIRTAPSTVSTSGLSQSFISPILDHTGARKRIDFPSDVSYESKRRKSEKGGKGLRHFSMKVCEKVRTKGITTYNEVADELVQEFASPNVGMSSIEQQFDQKNIRRRVYDALNVLMAMNIISKEKKEIKWLGLPTNSMQECTTLEKDRQKRIERLKAKTQQLHDLIIQQVAFKSLVERNKEREKEKGPPPPHGSIHLPFLIVNTAKSSVIDCSISNDKMEYLFNFDGTFEIHDDIEVLKRMGLALGLDKNDCTDEEIGAAKRILPKALELYIDQIAKRGEDWRTEFGDLEYEESYFPGDNVENVCYVDTSLSQHGAGLMTVEDLKMQAAIDSLQETQPLGSPIGEDEDDYGEEGDEVEDNLSD